MRKVRYGRATAENPGKHGPRDWRVALNDVAPTHGEMAFMLGFILLAEDRYPEQDLGRGMLNAHLNAMRVAFSEDRILEIASRCDLLKPARNGR